MAHMIREFRPEMTDSEFYNEGIEKVTGPVALMECTEAYTRYAGRNVTVLAPGMVFAYNWHEVRPVRALQWILARPSQNAESELAHRLETLHVTVLYPLNKHSKL